MAVSNGGTRAAVSGESGRILALDLDSGKPYELTRGKGPICDVEFVGEDRLAGTDVVGNIHLWEIRSGVHKVVGEFPWQRFTCAAIIVAAEAPRVIAGGIRDTMMVDLDSGRTTKLDMRDGVSFGVDISRDGRSFLASFGDGRLMVWEARGNEMRPRLVARRDGYAKAARLTADGQGAWLGEETGAFARIDLASGAIREIGRHASRITALASSPSGRWVATADTSGRDPDLGARHRRPGGGGDAAWRHRPPLLRGRGPDSHRRQHRADAGDSGRAGLPGAGRACGTLALARRAHHGAHRPRG